MLHEAIRLLKSRLAGKDMFDMDLYKAELQRAVGCIGGLNCKHCNPFQSKTKNKEKLNRTARARLKDKDRKMRLLAKKCREAGL